MKTDTRYEVKRSGDGTFHLEKRIYEQSRYDGLKLVSATDLCDIFSTHEDAEYAEHILKAYGLDSLDEVEKQHGFVDADRIAFGFLMISLGQGWNLAKAYRLKDPNIQKMVVFGYVEQFGCVDPRKMKFSELSDALSAAVEKCIQLYGTDRFGVCRVVP